MSLSLALLLACSGEPAAPPPSRVDAVIAKPSSDADLAGFCEVRGVGDTARPFAYPALDGAPPAEGKGWRWVNVWATWCGPCVEELPMLAKWEGQLQADGVDVDIQFLSVDEKAEQVASFRSAHPGMPESSRVQSFDLVGPWVASLGLSADTGIPIHVFVDPDDRIRCVRTGAMAASDYATIKKVMTLH